MRGEGNDKNQEGRIYFFKKCPACGEKIHISSLVCHKCGADYWQKCIKGEWKDIDYSSRDPANMIYCLKMNNVNKCMKCKNVLERGICCHQKHCFATGWGRCENCKTFDPLIFDCCQEMQKDLLNKEQAEELNKGMKKILHKEATATAEQQYTDDIPF